jgi:pectinesterase
MAVNWSLVKQQRSLVQPRAIIALRVLALIAAGAGSRLAADTNLLVAADGSGQFRTVQEAIMAVPAGSATNRVFIHVKPGVYKELIYVQREKRFFHLVGDDGQTTVLTYNLHANLPGLDGKPIGTFRTASTVIDTDDFTAENMTFEKLEKARSRKDRSLRRIQL